MYLRFFILSGSVLAKVTRKKDFHSFLHFKAHIMCISVYVLNNFFFKRNNKIKRNETWFFFLFTLTIYIAIISYSHYVKKTKFFFHFFWVMLQRKLKIRSSSLIFFVLQTLQLAIKCMEKQNNYLWLSM